MWLFVYCDSLCLAALCVLLCMSAFSLFVDKEQTEGD